MFPFLGFLSLFQFLVKKKKKGTCYSFTMPHPFKKSVQALAQCQAGQDIFSIAPKNISESDDCSAYHTSDGKTKQDSSDKDTTQSVNIMQALMADYLPAEMKMRWEASKQVSKHNMSAHH